MLERCEQSRVPVVNRSLGPNEQRLSGQLYYILVMLLRGRALDIAHNCGVGEGFETYRRLFEQYHPRVASRYVGSLSLILSTRFTSDIESELESFDKTIRRYESESGKTLDEEILLGVVVNGLQDQSIRDHIIRKSARLQTFSTSSYRAFGDCKNQPGLATNASPNGYWCITKGKGKGGKKGGKGDQKGSKGGKPSTKDGKVRMDPKAIQMLIKNVFTVRKRVI